MTYMAYILRGRIRISMASSRRQTRLTVFLAIVSLVMLMRLGAGHAQTTNITETLGPAGLGTNALDPVDGRTSIIGGTTA